MSSAFNCPVCGRVEFKGHVEIARIYYEEHLEHHIQKTRRAITGRIDDLERFVKKYPKYRSTNRQNYFEMRILRWVLEQ